MPCCRASPRPRNEVSCRHGSVSAGSVVSPSGSGLDGDARLSREKVDETGLGDDHDAGGDERHDGSDTRSLIEQRLAEVLRRAAVREHVEEVVVAEPGKRAPRADVALYHVGNDPDAHGWIVDALRERPGVVVLHEYVLHHLIAGITIGRGNGRAYLDAMERELGVAGRLLGLGVLDNLLPLLWETQPERFPLSGTILDLAQGLIVHSRFVEERARVRVARTDDRFDSLDLGRVVLERVLEVVEIRPPRVLHQACARTSALPDGSRTSGPCSESTAPRRSAIASRSSRDGSTTVACRSDAEPAGACPRPRLSHVFAPTWWW